MTWDEFCTPSPYIAAVMAESIREFDVRSGPTSGSWCGPTSPQALTCSAAAENPGTRSSTHRGRAPTFGVGDPVTSPAGTGHRARGLIRRGPVLTPLCRRWV